MTISSKYRVNRRDARNSHRVGVDQQLGNRTWAPLAGTYGTYTVEDMANKHEEQLERTYGAFLCTSCLECGTIAESKNQKTCKFCNAKLTKGDNLEEDKPVRGRPPKHNNG